MLACLRAGRPAHLGGALEGLAGAVVGRDPRRGHGLQRRHHQRRLLPPQARDNLGDVEFKIEEINFDDDPEIIIDYKNTDRFYDRDLEDFIQD